MSKVRVRVRDGREILINAIKVALTACAITALTLAFVMSARAAEIPPLKQVVAAAERASGIEAKQAAAVTPSVAPTPAPQPATISELADALAAPAMTTGVSLITPNMFKMAPIADTPKSVAKAKASLTTVKAGDIVKAGGEKHCLATAIYFEARGESAKGQKAVAEVILARTRTPGRPKSICGVVYEGSNRKTGCQFSFTCDRASDVARKNAAWKQAQKVAATVLRTGGKKNAVSGGATFYHADYVSPGWATRMVKVKQIGTHIFYRPKRGRLL